ncbi:NAD(P)/FAD-dependent oxidoreductase [bacterium]|nr:NAD(P)/FAD-dependent oxidoreductase [bacterium]
MLDLIVVGGGASGLMAAIAAAKRGKSVLILEKTDRCGKKIAITGKGRCNITNAEPIDDFYGHFGRNGLFLKDAFKTLDNKALEAFFRHLGLATVTERGGRVFPESQKASDVLRTLLDYAWELGVDIKTNCRCASFIQDEETKEIKALLLEDGTKYCAKNYLLACGGASYPLTGSDGGGAKLASKLGHTIVPLRPALVPLVVEGDSASRFQGVSLKNVRASLLVNGKSKKSFFGEMLFTHFGLSGPIILSLSEEAGLYLEKGAKVAVSVDLKPALTMEQLELRLLRDIAALGSKQVKALLKELLPAKMIEPCLEDLALAKDKRVSQLDQKTRKALRSWLKELVFPISATRPLKEAIVTAGGVKLKEIDPTTMRSRIVPNLLVTGELLDLAADTGGYNLQAAFSTGYLAGSKL